MKSLAYVRRWFHCIFRLHLRPADDVHGVRCAECGKVFWRNRGVKYVRSPYAP